MHELFMIVLPFFKALLQHLRACSRRECTIQRTESDERFAPLMAPACCELAAATQLRSGPQPVKRAGREIEQPLQYPGLSVELQQSGIVEWTRCAAPT